MNRKILFPALGCLLLVGLLTGAWFAQQAWHRKALEHPNFLLVIVDDQSWLHTSHAGYPAVQTPNFDRIAQEGLYFPNAYTSAPTCTASRSALLTGQHFWRLGSAAQLWGEFPATLNTYQKILAQHGYKTGFTGKGWGPGKALLGNPAGDSYNQHRVKVDPNLSPYDFVANFRQFLQERKPEQPFSFWISPTEPHRPYQTGIGVASGEIPVDKIVVPPFLPDIPEVRSDMADYLYEIQWFDRQLGDILKLMDEQGVLDNTIIVFTADNGMPFPRAKSNNYEYGTHVPFAVRWGNGISSHQEITDFVSLTDIAPTFLDLAGIPVPADMTGKSLREQLFATRSGRIDKQRNAAVTGFERHIADARFEKRGYPSRAIHTDKYLYIENFAPERWPAGRPPELADIDDGSPSKNALVLRRELYGDYWALAADKRPADELYALSNDPGQIRNLASDPEMASILNGLRARLETILQDSGDPCAATQCGQFDQYEYYGQQQQ